MLLQTEVESAEFTGEVAVSTEVRCSNLKTATKEFQALLLVKKDLLTCCQTINHLRTSQVSEVVEPVHVGPAVVEGVDELVCHHPVHVGLPVDVVLTQNDLRNTTTSR